MFSQLCINAILAGSIYALAGVSFSLIYQVQGFFHFTHGLACVSGAYAAYALAASGTSILVAGVLGVCTAGLVGAFIQACIIAPIRKRRASALVLLLASIGAYLVGQNVISLVFGDDLKRLVSTEVSQGLRIVGASITPDQIMVIGIAAAAILATATWLKRSSIGRNIRALSNDEQLAIIVGLPASQTRMTVMVIGSGLGGTAGVLYALDQHIVPTMGMKLLLTGVIAMLLGGRTSTMAAALGGMIISIAQNLFALWLPLAWQETVVFGLLLCLLLIRPWGLLGVPAERTKI